MKASGQSSEIRVKCCVLVYQRPWKWTNRVGILSDCPTPPSNLKCPLWNSQKILSDSFCFSFWNLPVLRAPLSHRWWDLMSWCSLFSAFTCRPLFLFSCSWLVVGTRTTNVRSRQWKRCWSPCRSPCLDVLIEILPSNLLLQCVHMLQHRSSVGLLMNPDVFLFHHKSSFSLISGQNLQGNNTFW